MATFQLISATEDSVRGEFPTLKQTIEFAYKEFSDHQARDSVLVAFEDSDSIVLAHGDEILGLVQWMDSLSDVS